MSYVIDVPEGLWTCYNWNLWKGVAWMLNFLVLQEMNQKVSRFPIKMNHSWAIILFIRINFTVIEDCICCFMEWNWAKSKIMIYFRRSRLLLQAAVPCLFSFKIVSTQPYDPLSCWCFTAYSGYPYCYNSRALSRFSYASDRRWGRYCIIHWRFQIWHWYDSSYISTAWLGRKCQTYRCSALWYHLPQSQSTSDTFQVSGCDACAVSFD